MSTFAILENGVVVNLVVADSAEVLQGLDAVQVPENAIPLVGWVYSLTGFADPNPPPPPVVEPVQVPQEVSAFQALAALHISGRLAEVETYMAHPDTPVVTKLAWQRAQVFRRNSPTVAALATMLGLNSTQIDDLFTLASNIAA